MQIFADPDKAKHAAKVAFSVVLVYGLAMQWGWMKPMWAAFAVIFCSLTSQGESLNKSWQRISGTFVGGIAVFVIIALFAQDRWLMLMACCVYLSILVYIMTGSKVSYIWQVSCFVVLAVLPSATGDSAFIFQTGMERIYETLLGCLVWTLIDMLVFPVTNITKLDSMAARLVDVQKQLFDWCVQQSLRVDAEHIDNKRYADLKAEQLQLIAGLEKALVAAGAESHEVRFRRQEWQSFLSTSQNLVLAFDQWQTGLKELVRIDLAGAVNGVEALLAAVRTDFESMAAVWSGEVGPADSIYAVQEFHAGDIEGLDNFDRAAVLVSCGNLQEVAELSRHLQQSCLELNDRPVSNPVPQTKPAAPDLLLPLLDPDRLRSVVFINVLVISSFLLWVWFDPPGHQSIWTVTGIFGSIAVTIPHMPIGAILMRVFGMVLPICALLYIFILPALSGFTELAVFMFAYYFAVQYWLKNPLAVMLASAGFLIMTGIANEQTYSFVGVAVAYLFVLLATLIVLTGGYLLGTPRPEKRLLGMLQRYFRGADYLLESMSAAGRLQRGPISKWRQQFYLREVTTLPKKMQLWSGQICPELFPVNSPRQTAAMVAGLTDLNYRLRELLRLREAPVSGVMAEHLAKDVAAWRKAIQQLFGQISGARSGQPDVPVLRKQLDQRLRSLDEKLNALLSSEQGNQISREERIFAYRVLGGYRGVSDAALGWLEQAGNMDFDDWRRECFS